MEVTWTERDSSKIIGIFEKSANFGFVVPTHSFGRDIFIPKKFCEGIENKKLVVCEVTFWGDKERKPEGKIIDVLGNPFDTDVMIEALIEREGLTERFSNEIMREISDLKEPEEGSEELLNRVDLRNLDIITIDGADAKDLDDAVYVEKLENNKYKLIVSIADVSYYVKRGSKLDNEAYKRGNWEEKAKCMSKSKRRKRRKKRRKKRTMRRRWRRNTDEHQEQEKERENMMIMQQKEER